MPDTLQNSPWNGDNRNMSKILIISALATALSACATPYQPEGSSGGYTDEPLGGDRFLVTFRGNGVTGESTVQAYALRRAREVCTENGFSKYEIGDVANRSTSSETASTTNCSRGYFGQVNCTTNPGFTVSKHSVRVLVQCKN